MTLPNQGGQAVWNGQYPQDTENNYITRFETSKNIAKEARWKSNFGRLSKEMSMDIVGQGPDKTTKDIGNDAAIWRKTITSGDECRFTLEQNMKGSGTYGDAEVRTGDYLAYLQQTVILNKTDTPALPIPEDMSRQRVQETLGKSDAPYRKEINRWMSEEYVYKVLDGYFIGASTDLMSPKNEGGRALDLGLGAGVQVSPENAIIAGTGIVSGTSGTTQYETQMAAALANLNPANTAHRITRYFLQELQQAAIQLKIKMIDGQANNGGRLFFFCDPMIVHRLSAVDESFYIANRDGNKRSDANKIFGLHNAIELDDFVIIPEARMMQYRPNKAAADAGTVQWGPQPRYTDRRDSAIEGNILLGMIWGEGAMLEATNGAIDITMETGRHGKGKELSGHQKQSVMRSIWTAKDGRGNDTRLNQQSMMVAVAEPDLSFGA